MTMADAIDAGHRQPCPTCGYDGGCPASHWIDNRGSVEELWPRTAPTLLMSTVVASSPNGTTIVMGPRCECLVPRPDTSPFKCLACGGAIPAQVYPAPEAPHGR